MRKPDIVPSSPARDNVFFCTTPDDVRWERGPKADNFVGPNTEGRNMNPTVAAQLEPCTEPAKQLGNLHPQLVEQADKMGFAWTDIWASVKKFGPAILDIAQLLLRKGLSPSVVVELLNKLDRPELQLMAATDLLSPATTGLTTGPLEDLGVTIVALALKKYGPTLLLRATPDAYKADVTTILSKAGEDITNLILKVLQRSTGDAGSSPANPPSNQGNFDLSGGLPTMK